MLAVLLVGCDGTTTVNATTCEGRIGLEPTVLATIASEEPQVFRLLDAGDDLVLVGRGLIDNAERDAVVRVDRCSGEMTALGAADRISDAMVVDDMVYFVNVDAMGYYYFVHRVPLAGGEDESLVGRDGFIRLVSGPGRPMAVVSSSEDERWNLHLHELVGDTWQPPLLTLSSATGTSAFSAVGANAEGVYFSQNWDAGGPLPLLRWAYGDTDAVAVDGTAGAGPIDARTEPIVFARQKFQTAPGTHAIVRNFPDGPEDLHILDATVTQVRARSEVVCWRTSDTIECLRDGTLRSVEQRDGLGPMVLGDAVYWLRPSDGGTELVAAVPL